MNLSQARAVSLPRPKPMRVGRGEATGVGKTSGKGHKGAKSRAGYSRRAYFVGGQMPVIRRIPKRGFSNAWGADYATVNVGDLNRFADGERVDVDRLVASGLVRRLGDGVKLLGDGTLSRKLTVQVHRVSASAKAKIEKAGGTVEALEKVTARPPKTPAAAPETTAKAPPPKKAAPETPAKAPPPKKAAPDKREEKV